LDLSFPRFDRDADVTVMTADLAVLMVGIAARQAASTTAAIQADIAQSAFVRSLFAPEDGAFNGAMAAALVRWANP